MGKFSSVQFLLFCAHLILGYLMYLFGGLVGIFNLLLIIYILSDIIINQDKDSRAGKWAAYYVGMEILFRMTNGFIFWEAGKYGVILILATGAVFSTRRGSVPWAFIVFPLLMIPSIAAGDYPSWAEFRNDVSFALSGPFCLAVSGLYFYRRYKYFSEFIPVIQAFVLPCVALLAYLTIATPNLEEIEFTSQSNFHTSGGFGPNQVSTVLGAGLFFTGLLIVYRRSLSGFLLIDTMIVVAFFYRGLITFSRGGVISGVIALLLLVTLYYLFKRTGSLRFIGLIVAMAVVSGIGYYVWDITNEQTGDFLRLRYLGISPTTGKQKDISAGRIQLMSLQFKWFQEEPVLGIGPGMTKYKTKSILGKPYSAHSEFTRLIGEHGLFGLFALLILFFFPISYIRSLRNEMKTLAIPILILVVFTMMHSAMRLALAGLIYGLVVSFMSAEGGIRSKSPA